MKYGGEMSMDIIEINGEKYITEHKGTFCITMDNLEEQVAEICKILGIHKEEIEE